MGYTKVFPERRKTDLITRIDDKSEDLDKYITSSKSGFGRGGMITKCSIAHKIAAHGIDVFIANGTRDSIISDIVRRKDVPLYPLLLRNSKRETGVKKVAIPLRYFCKRSCSNK